VPDAASITLICEKHMASPLNNTIKSFLRKVVSAQYAEGELPKTISLSIITTRTVPSGVCYVLDATQVWPDLWTTLKDLDEQLSTWQMMVEL